MKAKRKTLLISFILLMVVLGGFMAFQNNTNLFQGIDLYIFILIVILSIVLYNNALKRDKDEQAGLPTDDELSTRIKYKAGYYAFISSMYLWLFIFIKRQFSEY